MHSYIGASERVSSAARIISLLYGLGRENKRERRKRADKCDAERLMPTLPAKQGEAIRSSIARFAKIDDNGQLGVERCRCSYRAVVQCGRVTMMITMAGESSRAAVRRIGAWSDIALGLVRRTFCAEQMECGLAQSHPRRTSRCSAGSRYCSPEGRIPS